MNYKVGDRVRVKKNKDYPHMAGFLGTVMGERTYIAVQMDDFKNGHTCEGMCKRNGWWFEDRHLEYSKEHNVKQILDEIDNL